MGVGLVKLVTEFEVHTRREGLASGHWTHSLVGHRSSGSGDVSLGSLSGKEGQLWVHGTSDPQAVYKDVWSWWCESGIPTLRPLSFSKVIPKN